LAPDGWGYFKSELCMKKVDIGGKKKLAYITSVLNGSFRKWKNKEGI